MVPQRLVEIFGVSAALEYLPADGPVQAESARHSDCNPAKQFCWAMKAMSCIPSPPLSMIWATPWGCNLRLKAAIGRCFGPAMGAILPDQDFRSIKLTRPRNHAGPDKELHRSINRAGVSWPCTGTMSAIGYALTHIQSSKASKPVKARPKAVRFFSHNFEANRLR